MPEENKDGLVYANLWIDRLVAERERMTKAEFAKRRQELNPMRYELVMAFKKYRELSGQPQDRITDWYGDMYEKFMPIARIDFELALLGSKFKEDQPNHYREFIKSLIADFSAEFPDLPEATRRELGFDDLLELYVDTGKGLGLLDRDETFTIEG